MAGELVVGIDGSAESAVALRWAVEEAGRRQLPLTLIYALAIPVVSDAYGMVMTRPDIDELAQYSGQLLVAAEQAVRAQDPEVEVSSELRDGSPAGVLLEASRQAAGVVVGTRGLGAISGRLLGSVAVRLAAKAFAPVYVIPPEWDPGTCAGDPVVVGVDGSDHSEAALCLALEVARFRSAPVKAVIAYHVPWLARPVEPELIQRFHASERALAHRTVDHALEKVRTEADAATQIEVQVVEGKPADALVAAGKHAMLTVVGSRGRGAISRALLGSVSRAVMQETARPLAVVHARRAVG